MIDYIKAEVITIGDEILNGQTIDHNSNWISFTLDEIGVNVVQQRSVCDKKSQILDALTALQKGVQLVVTTGGLGPTKDDITKETVSEFFGVNLKLNHEVLEDIRSLFVSRNKPLNRLNEGQALLPENCIPIRNKMGTAAGMWFEEQNVIYIILPGVPHEMKYMMKNYVLPRLKEQFELPEIVHHYVKTVGLPESILAERIEVWESNLPSTISLAYLPKLGEVKLRFSASDGNRSNLQKIIHEEVSKLKLIIQKYIYGDGEVSLAEVVSDLLKTNHLTIATAESCTGGNLAARLTSLPGSSSYFSGAIVSYSNDVKINSLNVSEENLKKFGAVSEQVAIQMAEGVRKSMGVDIGISTTGIAGPEGGTVEKPVGTVWIAIATAEQSTLTKKLELGDFGRKANIELTTTTSMNLLRTTMLNNQSNM